MKLSPLVVKEIKMSASMTTSFAHIPGEWNEEGDPSEIQGYIDQNI